MNRNKNIRLLFSAGGTGGHILPAVAVADAIKKQWPDTDIKFVGAEGRMEMEKVPARGYEIEGLPIMGIQRSLTTKNLSFPGKLLKSLLKAKRIIKQFEPHAAVGFGGYASGPVLKTAQWKNIPTFIQEQNSYPGITNRWLAKKAKAIFVAYTGMETYFPKSKIIISGNPIRGEFFRMPEESAPSKEKYGFDKEKPVLFFMGGSQGARSINHAIAKNIDYFSDSHSQIIWQTGKYFIEEAKKLIDAKNLQEQIKPFVFIDDIHEAFAAADIVIARAGAISIAELSAAGKACIFVPLPTAAEDHQRKNALKLSENNAALMIEDSQAEKELPSKIAGLLENKEALDKMSEKIKSFAYPEASEKIANEIMRQATENLNTDRKKS